MNQIRPRSPSARARELGAALRQFREQAGLTGDELAKILNWSPSKISRMETGQRGTPEVDVAIYLTSCGIVRDELTRLLDLAGETDDGYWLRPHGSQLPDELRSLVIQETTAAAVTSFELARVPGLLQTEDYAREMIRHSVAVPADGVESRVCARLARQALFRKRNPPRLLFFVHEQALRLPVGGSAVMREQLLHLVFVANAQCTVRLVPSAAGAHAGLSGSFRLLEYPAHAPAVYVENEAASLFLEQPADVATYRKVVARLADIAMDGRESSDWLAALASQLEHSEA